VLGLKPIRLGHGFLVPMGYCRGISAIMIVTLDEPVHRELEIIQDSHGDD
jgi:hypothetical protein